VGGTRLRETNGICHGQKETETDWLRLFLFENKIQNIAKRAIQQTFYFIYLFMMYRTQK